MKATTPQQFVDALGARSGLICAVGAGGKKSALLQLARAHARLGTARIGITATVKIAPPPASLQASVVLGEAGDLAERLQKCNTALRFFARPPDRPGRLGGLSPEVVADLHRQQGFDVTLVKADGARMRLIKAPAADEPVLPPGAATVLIVQSARVLGQPLDERIAHRPELVEAIAGATRGDPVRPTHLAGLLAFAYAGPGRELPEAEVVPVINMVDDQHLLEQAREAASLALQRNPRLKRAVLARLVDQQPVIEIVTG